MRHHHAIVATFLIALVLTTALSSLQVRASLNNEMNDISSRSGADLSSLLFEGSVTYKGADLLYRSAVGDILPHRPGMEVATCSRSGVVAVTYGSDHSWTTETAWRSTFGDNPNDPAHVYSIAVADLLPERPGDEIVTVDMDDSVELIWKDGSVWKHETVFRDREPAQQMWLYEVAVGELPGTPEGPDIISVGDAGRTFVSYREGSSWTTKKIYEDRGPLDTCVIGDILPERDGNEIAVGGKDGNIVVLFWNGSAYSWSNIVSLGSNIMDLVLLDLEPSVAGNEIYSTTYSGGLYMTYRDNGSWRTERVHQEGAPIYGIEGGTIEGRPVISMATWNNRVALLYHDGGFKVKEIYRDDYLMMGTGIFDLDPYHQDNEIVGLSYYGRLHMFYHNDPKAEVLLPFDECVVTVNETVTVPIIVRTKGGFDGEVRLDVAGSGSTLSVGSLSGDGVSELRIVAPPDPGTIVVTVTARTAVSTTSRDLVLLVRDSGGTMDFDRHVLPLQVGSDRQVGGYVELLSDRDMGSPFVLDVSGVPMGLRLDLSESVCDPQGEPIPLTYTLTAEPWLKPAKYLFFLKGSLFDGRSRAIAIEALVTEVSVSDFMLIFDEDRMTAMEGTRIEVHILLQSIAGFSSKVDLFLPDDVEGLELSLSADTVVPTSTVTLTIEVVSGPGPFFIRVVGSGGNLTREDVLRLDTTGREGTIKMNVSSGATRLSRSDGMYVARFNIRIEPDMVPMFIGQIILEGLPEGVNATISPNNLRTLPYPVEVTVEVRTDKDIEGPVIFVMNVTPEGSTRHYQGEMTLLPYKENGTGVKNGIPKAFIIIAFTSVGIITGLVVLLLVSRRSSAHEQEVGRKKEGGARPLHSQHAETAQRHHGIHRGPDRLEHSKR